MPKKDYGEIALQLMKEKLAKHLDYVEALIKNWLQEISVPRPFVIGDKSWPAESVYIPSSEKDKDKNHIIRRHLRSRTLWRNHSDWEREIREIERLGVAIYGKAKEKCSGSSRNYLQTALWAAFEIATKDKIKQKYELVEGKGVAFYGHIIENPRPKAEDKVEDEHWGVIKELSECKEMAELIKTCKEAETPQKRIIELANKALLSSDIFYPCKYCKRLMKA